MIGCFSLARETFDIDFAKTKLAKTKKLIRRFAKVVFPLPGWPVNHITMDD